MHTLITVAVCTRNRATLLGKAVSSVLAQANGGVEILIVDNGSTDNTAALSAQMAATDPCVRRIYEQRTGLSMARNAALQQANGDWVVFLDDDAVVEPGWLLTYEKFLQRSPNPRIAVVGGAVIPHYEAALPAWMGANFGRLELGPNPYRFPSGGHPWECNCAYRREAALQAGGFDPRLGHHGEAAGSREGADLNLRLRNAGYEVWWLPGATIRHLVHADRMNLKWFLRAAFNEGRSIAIQRLKSRAPGVRKLYIAGRILLAPLHCGINLLVALATIPFQHRRLAVGGLARAARIAGLTCELIRQTLNRHSVHG